MSRSNWGTYLTLAGGVILAVAVFGSIAERGLEGCHSARQKPGYATHPDSALQTIPPGQTRVRPFQSIYKHLDCQKPNDKDDYALCVQWRSAEATAEQACISGQQFLIGGVLSILGLGGLLATVIYTAKSASAASDAAVQMARQVEVQIRTEQPHLRVSSIETKIDPEEDWQQVDLLVQNLGKTAAVLIEWAVQCEVLAVLPETPRYRDPVKMRGRILRADDKDKGMDLPIFLSEADANAVYYRQETVYLWGYFRYEDVFGRTRKSGFGYRGDPMGEEPGVYIGVLWSRTGDKSYNYDEDENENEREDT